MADLIIHDTDVSERLRRLAEEQDRSVEDVLRSLLDKVDKPSISSNEALLAMDGMFDDDITDLSSITKEDVMNAYRKKYADSN